MKDNELCVSKKLQPGCPMLASQTRQADQPEQSNLHLDRGVTAVLASKALTSGRWSDTFQSAREDSLSRESVAAYYSIHIWIRIADPCTPFTNITCFAIYTSKSFEITLQSKPRNRYCCKSAYRSRLTGMQEAGGTELEFTYVALKPA